MIWLWPRDLVEKALERLEGAHRLWNTYDKEWLVSELEAVISILEWAKKELRKELGR